MPVRASFQINDSQPEWRIYFSGNWTVTLLEDVDTLVREVDIDAGRTIIIDLTQLEAIDTAGAWVIYRFNRRVSDGRSVNYDGVRPEHQTLLEVVAEHEKHVRAVSHDHSPYKEMLAKIGLTIIEIGRDIINSLGFFGEVLEVLRKAFVSPKKFRKVSLIHHIESSGLDALPIVVLISFLIGAVLAFMGADILKD